MFEHQGFGSLLKGEWVWTEAIKNPSIKIDRRDFATVSPPVRTSAEARRLQTSYAGDYPLVRAAVRIDEFGVRQLAVIDRKDGNRLIGLLTMSDIVRAHAQAAVAAGDPDRTVVPEFTEVVENVDHDSLRSEE